MNLRMHFEGSKIVDLYCLVFAFLNRKIGYRNGKTQRDELKNQTAEIKRYIDLLRKSSSKDDRYYTFTTILEKQQATQVKTHNELDGSKIMIPTDSTP